MYPLTSVDASLTAAGIVAFAALLHASFQVAATVLTNLSGHAIGHKRSQGRLLRLMWSYISGVGLMSLLLLASIIALLVSAPGVATSPQLWLAVAAVGIATGLTVLAAYSRQSATLLWLPAAFADYLLTRTKRTRSSAEAFGLGLTTGAAELPFLIAPLLLVAATIITHAPLAALATMGYVALAVSPLLVILALVGGGTSIGRIARWQADHQRFLQLACGTGLLVLSVYVFVIKYVEVMVI